MRLVLLAPMAVLALFLVAAGSPSCPAQQWVTRYSTPGFGPEEAVDMAVDAAGNSYVVGTSDGAAVIIKYNVAGQQVWLRTYDAPGTLDDRAIAVWLDAQSNVYVTGGSGINASNAFTVKYTSEGQQSWVARYTAPRDTLAAGADVATDQSGNVYVLVLLLEVLDDEPADDFFFPYDFAVVKYSPAGRELWDSIYASSNDGLDIGTALAVDAAGNVYVTGAAQSGTSTENFSLDMITLKYSPSGTRLWQARYKSPQPFGFVFGAAIALDGAGNPYVTGGDFGDVVTIKYSSGGSQVWLSRETGSGSDFSFPGDLKIDGQGNVFVVAPTQDAWITYKLSPGGQKLWGSVYTSGGFEPGPVAVALDAQGNAYVTGSGSFFEMHTVKYAPDGTQVWAAKFADETDVFPIGLGVDAAGNVIVGATSGGSFDETGAILAVRYSQGAD